MAIITLTSDFGNKDPYVAQVKGALLSLDPNLTIVDISHEISPFNIQEAAYILGRAYLNFPEGTIHIFAIDSEPGQGVSHLAAKLNGHYFVGADNGFLALMNHGENPEEVVNATIAEPNANSFNCLTNLVPLAGKLAKGTALQDLGERMDSIKCVKELEPRTIGNGNTLTGNVNYIDNYGNVMTNISKDLLKDFVSGREFEIVVRGQKIKELHDSYNQIIDLELPAHLRKGSGHLFAVINESGYLELVIYKSDPNTTGGAATLLGLKLGTEVRLNLI